MKVEFNFLPLNAIEVDPELTCEALGVAHVATADEQVVNGYIGIQNDFRVTDFIRVWKSGNQYFLIANYSCFVAHQKFHSDNLGQKVGCVILSDATKIEIQEHTERMKILSEIKVNSHLSRLITVKLLLLAGSTYEDLKRFRGIIGNAQSERGKMLERDYKLASSDYFFSGLLGVKDLKARPIKPDLDEAIYPYGFCANKLLSILGTNERAIAVFHEKYFEYLEDVRLRSRPEDLDVKPIYLWTNVYIPEVVIELAEAAALGSGYLPPTRSEDKDQEWKVDRTITHDIKVPAFNYNQRDIDVRNIKRLAEFEYKTGIMNLSARSHIDRIRPIRHGDLIRTKNKDIDPGYESPMNNFEFDSPYFEWVRRRFMLAYCVRWRLLKSIGLRAEHFGFPDYKPSSTTTYKTASARFNDWYQTEFLGKMVFRSRCGQAEHHPRYRIYFGIKSMLELAVLEESQKFGIKPQPVFFKDFCREVFHYIFENMDREDALNKFKARALHEAFGETTPDELKALMEFLTVRRNQISAEEENNNDKHE